VRINRWLFVLLSAIALSIGGCSQPWGRRPPNKAVVVLVDFSDSTAALRGFYLERVRRILTQMDHGDFLAVCRITASSVNEPGVLLQEEFPRFVPTDAAGNPTDNPILVRQAREKAKAELEERKAKLEQELQRVWAKGIEWEKALHTDIMGSLTIAQNLFAAYRRNRSVLVVLSDMLEDSERYNFTRKSPDEKETEKIIAAEDKAGRLPRLDRVKVYVVAPSSGNTARFFAVRNFWLRYFAACGAKLLKENYSNELPARL
jgi:hypothetical protein